MAELNEKEKYIKELEIDLTKNNDGTPAVDKLLDTEVIVHENELKELTEEEKREEFIKQLKESKIRNPFRPIKHDGNITTNQFNTNYKRKRRVKNKQQKKSRRLSR
jgi:hypothetical protein